MPQIHTQFILRLFQSIGLALILVVLNLQVTYAHGFGERYDLPIPLEYYIIGAALTVVLSFFVIGIYVKVPGSTAGSYLTLNILQYKRIASLFKSQYITSTLQLISIAFFLLAILSGLFGDQNPNANFSPVFLWVICWVGLSMFVSIVGNIWLCINPWNVIFGAIQTLLRHIKQSDTPQNLFEYPNQLGVWPAIAQLFLLVWIENIYPHASEPRTLAIMLLIYSSITWTGMLLFGRHAWLKHGELFAVIFSLLARFAITEIRVTNNIHCKDCVCQCSPHENSCINCLVCWDMSATQDKQLNLRPIAVGLTINPGNIPGTLHLVILLLASVSFDGLSSTPAWLNLQNGVITILLNVTMLNHSHLMLVDTLGLLAVPISFLSIYLLFTRLTVKISSPSNMPGDLYIRFSLALIPIAIAYTVAHYFTYLITVGQLIIPAMSDPFGYGWNLIGTSDYAVNIGIIDAKLAWFLAVGSIVTGHVIAVYTAHIIAIGIMPNSSAMLRSQYPMLILMVIYTVVSLWIVAQQTNVD